MSLPEGARTLQEVADALEKAVPLRRAGVAPRPKPGFAFVFVRLNGASKHELCVQFPTGVAQVIATEP
jgi:ATP-dependent Clp protease ATP-binding subunit ClpA